MPWVRTPPGAPPLRVRDLAGALVLGGLLPAGVAWGVSRAFAWVPAGPPWLLTLAGSPVGKLVGGVAPWIALGAAPALPLLATVGAAGAWLLHGWRVGGLLSIAAGGAVVGAAAPLMMTGSPGYALLGAGPGLVFALCFWLALRLLRPAAFVAARTP